MNKKNPQSLFKISPVQPCCLKQKSGDVGGYLGWGKSIGKKKNSICNLGPFLTYRVMSELKLQSELSLSHLPRDKMEAAFGGRVGLQSD